ncbi:MAG: EAL domain-containing response regulator [Pseudomonadota bacterium]
MNDRLLMIDDDANLIEIYARVGKKAGYDVTATADPAAFWVAVENWHPTLIVVDLRMPNTDGVEILRGLAARQVRAQVVLSSGSDPYLLETAERIGVERGLRMRDALPKPISPDELRSRLYQLRFDGTEITEQELRAALEGGEFHLAYQPKIDLRTRSPVGVEALVRWTSPARGKVSPVNFIPLAEKTDLIDLLTRTVLTQALTQMAAWGRAGLGVPVAVNVSPVNLKSLSFPR